MTTFKVKTTSFETLRRNGDDLRRVVDALVPDQNKDGASKMLYDILRNWNLRSKRKDRKFEGEWLFRTHPQWIVEGVATSQSKSERCLKTLVSKGYLIRREALMDGRKTLHLQPSPSLEEIVSTVSDAIEGLMGAVTVRRFLRPLLDWTKRQDTTPTTLHFYFKDYALTGEPKITSMKALMDKTVEHTKAAVLAAQSVKKADIQGKKMPGWDDAPLEVHQTKLKDYDPLQTDKNEGLEASQSLSSEGTLYSNKGTLNKGTEDKVTGLATEGPEIYSLPMSAVEEATIKADKITFSEKDPMDVIAKHLKSLQGADYSLIEKAVMAAKSAQAAEAAKHTLKAHHPAAPSPFIPDYVFNQVKDAEKAVAEKAAQGYYDLKPNKMKQYMEMYGGISKKLPQDWHVTQIHASPYKESYELLLESGSYKFKIDLDYYLLEDEHIPVKYLLQQLEGVYPVPASIYFKGKKLPASTPIKYLLMGY